MHPVMQTQPTSPPTSTPPRSPSSSTSTSRVTLSRRQHHRWSELMDAITEREEITGRPVPCRLGDLDATAPWTSPDRDAQDYAAACCLAACPALGPCRDYVNRYPREAGVYGGKPEHSRIPR